MSAEPFIPQDARPPVVLTLARDAWAAAALLDELARRDDTSAPTRSTTAREDTTP